MDYYFKIALILAPILFLLWKGYKLAKYTEKVENAYINLINMLESSNNKELILDYIKKTELYNDIVKR